MATCIIKNSTISFAEKGIFSHQGGIIRARNTIFRNNIIGSEVLDYWHPSQPDVNACYFMGCTFEWTRNVTTIPNNAKFGLFLKLVEGINIGGCIFQNTDADKYCADSRGIGIKATTASFQASKSGNTFCDDDLGCPENCYINNNPQSRKNTFASLYRGIEFSTAISQFVYSLLVRSSDFVNNYSAIRVFQSENSKIYNCTFTNDRADLDAIFYNDGSNMACYTSSSVIEDIVFDECVGYEIYNNIFEFTGKNINHVVAKSYNLYKCRIQQNTFTNNDAQTIATDNVVGICVKDNNAYLEIYCNTFNDLGSDIKLLPGGEVINPLGGNNDDPAGNIFSDDHIDANGSFDRFRIDNYTLNLPVTYHYYKNNSAPRQFPNNFGGQSFNTTEKDVTDNEKRICTLTCEDFYTHNSSIGNIAYNNAFTIFPNPANQFLTITSNAYLIKKVMVINTLGQIIEEEENNILSEKVILNSTEWQSGLYSIVILTPDNKIVTKKTLVIH